jgi:hypothetical protein
MAGDDRDDFELSALDVAYYSYFNDLEDAEPEGGDEPPPRTSVRG